MRRVLYSNLLISFVFIVGRTNIFAEEGREIFAVPGSPLDPRAEGANDLLRDGATFCTRAEDVIEALAEQNLSREQPIAGFFEPGFVGRGYEPLWDELDLPGVDAALFGPAPANPDDGAPPPQSGVDAAKTPAEKPAGRPREGREGIERRLIALLGPVPVSVDELARASEATAPLERGLRLSPYDPQNFVWFNLLALARLFSGRAEAGLEAAARALQVRPNWWTSLEVLACCYAALGKWDEARRCAQQMASVTKQPGDVLAPLRAHNPAWAEQMTNALRRVNT